MGDLAKDINSTFPSEHVKALINIKYTASYLDQVGAAMLKHRGFPGRLPGSDFQFTIRRAADKPTAIIRRERYADRKKNDLKVDAFVLAARIDLYGEDPFPRGNLDAEEPLALWLAFRGRAGAGTSRSRQCLGQIPARQCRLYVGHQRATLAAAEGLYR